ncbi:MAG: DDE-type integrase/transposase/recombinase, partial [Terriglobales bacterium]
ADGVRADKNKSRWFEEHPEQAVFAQRKYFHERLSVQLTYEAMKREFGDALKRKCEDSDRVCVLNYDTVREFLNAQPRPLAIMAREGEAEYHERCAPYIIRGYVDLRVNQCWCADHMTHDVWVRNAGYFPGIDHDDALRPWISVWMDLRSRKIVGAVWYHTPSSYTAGSALRLALGENGVPEGVLTDHGKDYMKLGRHDDLSPETNGVLARLGIEVTNAIPYNAQAKPVESWFGNRLHERFDKLWRGFYCGSSPIDRPDDCTENLARHKAWMEGKAGSSPLPLASEFVALARDFILEYNTELPHRGKGMEGRCPQAVFDALLPADQRKPVADTAALDALFWDRQKRRVSEGGCVQIYNARYEPADNDSRIRLFMEIERDVLVACDPTNLGEALALDQDGRLIGRLVAQKLLAQGPVSHEDIKVRMKLQRKLRRATKDTIAAIGYGISSELDVRRLRAGIAPAAAAVAVARQLPAAANYLTEPEEYIDDLVERFAGGN